jgi:hypothetical protein
MKLSVMQPEQEGMPNLPRGGDNRQPAELQRASDMVPLHSQTNVQGMNPREVAARG